MIVRALKRGVPALAVTALFALAPGAAEGQSSRGAPSLHSSRSAAFLADSVAFSRVESLFFTVQIVGLDTAGHYGWSGPVERGLHGQATGWLMFESGPPAVAGEWGEAAVRGRWTIYAADETQSFDASVGGTINMLSGQGHLAGAITGGRGRGQFVQIETQFLEFGPNRGLSGLTGTLRISPALAAWADTVHIRSRSSPR